MFSSLIKFISFNQLNSFLSFNMKQPHKLIVRIKFFFFPFHSYVILSLTPRKELSKMRYNEECIFQWTLYSLSVFALETCMMQISKEVIAA